MLQDNKEDGMAERERIREQMKRAFEGDAWHGPGVREVLDGVTAAQAGKRVIPDAHTIGELVLHMACWKDVVRRRLAGEKVQVSDAENFPKLAPGDTAWRAAREALDRAHQDLVAAVQSLDESKLDKPLVPGGSAGYVQLHGIIQHDLYHAGQIAILKKG
jgi:uncharacterized damage-inducible protein DinB